MALGKRLADLMPVDIQALIDDGWPESETLEFKQAIPCRKRDVDRWYTDQDEVGEYGRNELLAEVVAFANSQGGDLVLGVSETRDKPPRANGILPLPACTELAHRLEQMARDCIEPAIPLLAAQGIPTADNGEGIVIIRVPASRAAPHRLIPTRECYHRRRERTERMTMRDIRDLTLAIDRGQDAVDRRLRALQEDFRQAVSGKPVADGYGRLSIGLCAVPMTLGLFVANVHRTPSLALRPRDYRLRFINGGEVETHTHVSGGPLRPSLRGARTTYADDHRGEAFHLWSDGAIGWWRHLDAARVAAHATRRELRLYASWLAGDVLNVGDWADRYRQEASAIATEYALHIEIVTTADVPVFGFANEPFGDIGHLRPGNWALPTYSLAGADERPILVGTVLMDLWNLVGADFGDTAVNSIERVNR